MPLYSLNGSYPQPLPYRIRLSDGRTKTDQETFSAEDLADAGLIEVSNKPDVESTKAVEWDGQWIVRDKTEAELQADLQAKWNNVREKRNILLAELSWRYERYNRLARLGKEQVDDIANLDEYAQKLADIPQVYNDPADVIWPVIRGEEIVLMNYSNGMMLASVSNT